jgi:hypothetical protein
MGHSCIHDGGVTEPHCRAHGCVPKARQRGSGVQLKPLWARQVRGSIPICMSRVAVTPTGHPLTNHPSYTHRLLQSVGRSGILLSSLMMALHVLACHQCTMTRPCLWIPIPGHATHPCPISLRQPVLCAVNHSLIGTRCPATTCALAQAMRFSSKTCNSWHRPPSRSNSTEGFGGLRDAPEIVSKQRWGFLACLEKAESYP